MDSVETPGGGRIGMRSCPGRDSSTGGLAADLDVIRDWGAVAVVTLMEAGELERYAATGVAQEVGTRGMVWRHLPVRDMGVPGAAFEATWVVEGAALRAHLGSGRRVVLHCLGGLGRTGTISARLLVEMGVAAEEAIRAVRAARPGAIETPEQEAYVRASRTGPDGAST